MLDPMGMSTHSGETKGVKRESVPIDYVPPASEIGPAKTTMSLIGNTHTGNTHDETTPNAATLKDVVARRDPITGEIHYVHNTHTITNSQPQHGINKDMIMYTIIGVAVLMLITK